MKQYNSVEDLREDFSNINQRLSKYNGSSDRISDSGLLTELREFNSRLSGFVGGAGGTADRSTEHRESTAR